MICPKCELEKGSEFHGKCKWCTSCYKNNTEEYRAMRLEEIKEYRRVYGRRRRKNKDLVRQNDKVGMRFDRLLVMEKTTEKTKDGCYKYKCLCDCGKEVFLSSAVLNEKYHTKSCGCLRLENSRKAMRRPWGVSAFDGLLHHYKRNAEIRGLEFDLSTDEFREITSKNCHYCGIFPSQEFKSRTNYGGYVYNGVDRVDNSLGYKPSNCVPCCKFCNIAKGTMSAYEFLELIERIHNHQCVLSLQFAA